LMWGMRRHGIAWRNVVNQTLAPNLPPALHGALRRLAGAPRREGFKFCAVSPELARRTGVLDRMRQSGEGFVRAADGNSRALCLIAINRRDRGPGIEAIRNRYGFTATSPTADRRVIELCVSIPEEQFIHKGQPRSLIRTAMAGILPPAILNERRRGRQGVGCQAALNAARQDIAREVQRLEASPLARRCLDVPRLRRLMDDWDDARVASSDTNSEYLQVLGRGLAAGQFLRRFEADSESIARRGFDVWEEFPLRAS
jgi:asparagine synthase (glutamine-hydrolysing)